MMVTVDKDNHNPFSLIITIVKGFILFKKKPDYFKWTRRGFHLKWVNLKITKRDSFKFRMMLGDDYKRIKLDMCSPYRVTQILFTRKVVFKNENGNWILIQR